MQQPLQITFRDVEHSEAVAERIRRKILKLDKFYPNLVSCHVVIEMIQHHHHKGNLHNVAIHAFVPGHDINVSKQPNENLYLAIQEAVDGLWEQLDTYRSLDMGDVKDHGEKISGEIVRLISDEEYGFIVDAEDNEYYFNLTHLVNAKFFQLHIGEKVRFLSAIGKEGMQARRVSLVKHETRH